ITDEDIAYLLTGYNHYFHSSVSAPDILGSFAGLRPLLRSRAEDPSSQSREFRVFDAAPGLIAVAGGKFTTYRYMAEVITDRICERLGRKRRCRTARYSLHGAPSESWQEFAASTVWTLRARYKLSEPSARHLVQRYGSQ